jgi:DMSO/TMAO reductase YedYZ heme-binding membrane subunit
VLCHCWVVVHQRNYRIKYASPIQDQAEPVVVLCIVSVWYCTWSAFYVLYLLNCGALVDQLVNDASHFKNCSQLVVVCVVLGLRPYSAVLYLGCGA